ncbi:MAG: protein translocase subunit SecD [Patescibacteria group bacterium]
MKIRLAALGLVVLGLAAGYFVYPKWGAPEWFNVPFRLGLDLKGGVHLTYRADLSKIEDSKRAEALEGLRDVVERRVNFFGVAEPLVRVERTREEDRLQVQLAGVFDAKEAIALIGETPYVEFRTAQELKLGTSTEAQVVYVPTELTGRFVERAALQFDPTAGPFVELIFNSEGARLFEELTAQNVGKSIAIYLDGAPISIPVVQEKISGGKARITGRFTTEEARTLVQRLNSGALPVPIELISQQTVEPAHGEASLRQSFFAAVVGLLFVIGFMIAWYRLPGLVAVLALGVYTAISLSVFKLIPVTFSTAGIAGFVLSIGMAVDANILIFERMKEELRKGKTLGAAIEEGFERAWTSIRDSNASSLITAVILWYFGSDAVKGFALTLGLGVAISMFSAITVTRTFLRAFHSRKQGAGGFFYASGFNLKP